MARRARRALSAAAILLVLTAAPSHGAPANRIIVVWLDGMSLADWSRSGGPSLQTVMNEGAVGVLHTGPAGGDPTIAAQEAGANTDGDVRALKTGGMREGFGEAFTRASRSVGIIGTETQTAGDARAYSFVGPDTRLASVTRQPFAVDDPSSPVGRRTDVIAMAAEMQSLAETTSAVIVDISDAGRLDALLVHDVAARDRWIGRSLAQTEVVIGAARTAMGPDGTVVVISAPGPRAREMRSGSGDEHLGAIAIAGPSFGPGLLASSTTHVPGLVSLTDVAPTLIRVGGLSPHRSLNGSIMRVVPSVVARARAVELDGDLVDAARTRPRVALVLFGSLAFACLISALLFAGRRGGAPRGNAPIHLRDLALIIFAACAVAPGILLLDRTWRAVVVAGICGLIARVAIGARWCVPVLCLAGLAPLIAAVVDPRVAATSVIGAARATNLPASVEPALLGLALASLLVAFGMISDARRARADDVATSDRARRGVRAIAALALGAGAVLLSQDLRMIAVGIVPVAWFIARSTGTTTLRALIFVTLLALIAGMATTYSTTQPFGYVDEVRRWFTDHTTRFDLVALAALAGAPLLLVMLRRRDEIARASFGSPGLRAAVGAGSFLALGIAVAYPGGAEAAAWSLIPTVCIAGAIITGSRSAATR